MTSHPGRSVAADAASFGKRDRTFPVREIPDRFPERRGQLLPEMREAAQPVLVRGLNEALSRIGGDQERELSLVVARAVDGDPHALLAALAGRLRVIDTASTIGAQSVGVLLPRFGADEAYAFAGGLSALGVGKVSAGIATAPFDGIDADTLLGGARAACAAAHPGSVARVRDAAETITAGSRRILVADPAMARLYELARRFARSAMPILILGETGAGKDLVAAAIHAFSPRAEKPFVAVNCAAIPESLAESELFGHARGAFSGATTEKAGHLEVASGGTLFLDEIGELSPPIQAKLLRVLEGGELRRIGETSARTIDLRIVAATNRDLQRDVDDGRFRSDLFFRLGSARLELPPLRDRPRDIALLGATLLGDACRRLGRRPLQLSVGAAIALFRHGWPGNIRELCHVIEYAAASAPDSACEVEISHLPRALAAAIHKTGAAAPAPGVRAVMPEPPPDGEFRPIAVEVRQLERVRMIAALRASGGVQHDAAGLIEMPLRTFSTKIKRYAIAPCEWVGE